MAEYVHNWDRNWGHLAVVSRHDDRNGVRSGDTINREGSSHPREGSRSGETSNMGTTSLDGGTFHNGSRRRDGNVTETRSQSRCEASPHGGGSDHNSGRGC